jgi:hypothetical protein
VTPDHRLALSREDDVDGHYIEIGGSDNVVDLADTLTQLLHPTAVRGGGRSFPLLALPGGTEVFVDELGDGLAVLAISHPGSTPTRRRAGAQRVYDVLAERTLWALRWTADEAPGAIVVRPALPRDGATTSNLYLVPEAG